MTGPGTPCSACPSGIVDARSPAWCSLCLGCASGGSPRAQAHRAREAARPHVGRRPERPRGFGSMEQPEAQKRKHGRPEASTKDRCKDALNALPGVWVRVNSVGLANVGATGKLFYGMQVGAADLLGSAEVLGLGVYLSVETKAPRGATRTAQESWAAQVRAGGGIALRVGQGLSAEEAAADVVARVQAERRRLADVARHALMAEVL